MAGFSIDDVRDSFTKDMGYFIEDIEVASRAVALDGLPAFAEGVGDTRRRLEKIGDAGHSIAGTSGLIDVMSMSNTARLLEELVAQSHKVLAEVEAQVGRLRRLGGLCQEGSKALRSMLECELAGDRAEASALAERFENLVLTSTPAARTSLPLDTNTPTTEFEFGDEPPSTPDGHSDDLGEVFREEARAAVVTLQGYLQLLTKRPDDMAATTQVERLYHTLKGAAAAVGLVEVQRLALGLQHTMESVLQGETRIDGPFLSRLVTATNQMLQAADVPLLAPLRDARRTPETIGAKRYFSTEATQLIDDARALLQQLPTATTVRAKEIRGELGRFFHRLKGSAVLVDEQAIAEAAAELQTACQGHTAGATQIDLGLAAIEGLLGRMTLGPTTQAQTRPVTSRMPLETPVAPAPRPPTREAVSMVGGPELWDSFELECAELFEQVQLLCGRLVASDKPRSELEALMRAFHTLKGVLSTVGLAPVARIVHQIEDFLEATLERSLMPPMRLVADLLPRVIEGVKHNLTEARTGWVTTAPEQLRASLDALSRGEYRPLRPRSTASSEGTSEHDGVATDESRDSRESLSTDVDRRFLRVAIERLDALMNLAGELVVSRSRLLSRIVALRGLQGELVRSRKRLVETVDRFRGMYEFAWLDGRRDEKDTSQEAWDSFGDLELDRYDDIHVLARSLAEIGNDASEIDEQVLRELASFGYDSDGFSSIVAGIQSEITRARMVPLGAMFARLKLTARDAAEREHKGVRVETVGEEVSLDKTMADALFPPLLHLVRNAVSHGIEGLETRRSRGKNETGLLTLEARQESGQIVVEIRDDGAGLDLVALRARGVELGLVRGDTPIDDPAVAELVFAKGLSTKAVAGDVSGRGVGGEVVRRTVERLNGTVRVSTSQGGGTTFRVTVPLTLAITRAILVAQGSGSTRSSYAVALYFADRIVASDEVSIVESAGLRRVRVGSDLVALYRLSEVLASSEPTAAEGPILILRVGDQRLALQVDAIIAQEEIVVKSLGELLTGHPMFAGMTIRGNGELVLILDILDLIESRARANATPRSTFEGDTIEDNAIAASVTPAASARGRVRVLFADDSVSVRKVAERALVGLGYEVVTAIDGAEALDKLRAERFDIVFTDLEMPRMHGYELIRELRFVPALQSLPIVVVSSRSGEKHQAQARSLGATDYFTKPFTAEALDSAIRRLVGRGGE